MKNNLTKQLVISILAVTIISCCPQRHIVTNNSESRKIEVIERIETLRDTVIITIPAQRDSALITIDSISILENSVARSRAQVVEGRLLHTLESITEPIIHPFEVDVVVKDSIIYHEKITEHIVEVERELTLWQKIEIRGFWILILLLLWLVASKLKAISLMDMLP
ncbi:MAG: hypothetical protein SNJ33_01685 [Rikenellaceae bacterium]